MTDQTYEFPPTIVAEFGQPDAWALTVVDITSPEVPHWRTLGYTGALRQLEVTLANAGKDIHSGEWRVYEFTSDEALIDEVDPANVRVVLAVARGVKDAA
jgi:hypothetical protein